MNKVAIAIILAIIGFGAIGAVVWMNREDADAPAANPTVTQSTEDQDTTDSNPPSTSQSTPDQTVEPLTTAEVATHNTASDCWTIIENKVYDITSYVRSHPGGNEISRACGVDATSLFTQRTTAEGDEVGSGTPHSSSAERTLNQFLLGDLVN